ncbi:universal stress protein A [Aureimonas sp. SA4125]|uniref:universal stress protein n=1 Tax=Aureimonas sp. SA4125 TaxID=2826993 RepID=UPI001CC34A5A|nr:universal stress protein [Aureimonas sp. SA4125]BDA83582.1 universal stress protein A [Aureimonas sp. SA4125]
MSREFKNVLVVLAPQEETVECPTPALKMGLALAREANAFVTVSFMSPQPAWVPLSLFSDAPADMIATERKRLDTLAETCLAAAVTAADAADIQSSTEFLSLDFLALMGRAPRLAQLQDVLVMDARSAVLREYPEIVEGMLFRSGRPVVLVPEGWTRGVPRTVSIAWDGSLQATHAVAEALPILQGADEVHVVTVTGEKDLGNETPSDRLAIYLDRHGVRVRENALTTRSGSVADTLREHVAASGSDMLVMGAYAHSRIREAILGGVTRSLLGASPVPLFLSH